MSLWLILTLLAIIAIGTYVQTVTGFGLGMIVMGVTSGFDLVSVPYIAMVISFVSMVNSGVALPGKMHLVDWPIARAVMIGVVPASILGVVLLDYLAADFSRALQFMLGVVIIYSGVLFAFRPRQLKATSSLLSFFFTGFSSGLFGGLFGMAGPPVIFHFYRQPMTLAVVRTMLLLIFALTSSTRTLFVMAQGQMDSSTFLVSILAVPLVALVTIIGRKFPPPLPPESMRRLAYIALVLIGLGLLISATFS